MKVKKSSETKQTYLFFSIAYVLFVFSLFNRDVSNTDLLYKMTIPAKYIALVILITGIMFNGYLKRYIKNVFILLCIDAFIFIKSGVLIFIIISLFAFYAINVDDKYIIKMAYYTLLFFTISVVIFSALGIYNDEITSRWVGSAARHSIGFYHSNVLPLVYFYLVGYGLSAGILKKKHYLILIVVDIIIYYICGSRNSLMTVLLLIFGKMLIEAKIINGSRRKYINKILRALAKIIVPLLTIISICVPLLLEDVAFFRILDHLFSYRFTSIANMINNLGIRFISQMTNDTFFNYNIVIDNGYAFLSIRYGIFMIVFLSVFVYLVSRKYKENTFVLFLIIVVAFSNFIDNDLIDYSVLPYLIISEKCAIEYIRGRSRYGRSYKCNNEYLQ